MSKQEPISEGTEAAAAAAKAPDGNGGRSREKCAVCLQTSVLPVTLPCGHIFCFLCVKGFAPRSRCCALCRYELPRDFCEHPRVLDPSHVIEVSQRAISSDGSQWYYSGANGWWQYEERIAKELEEAFAAKRGSVSISISGFQYIVDFSEMVQYKESDPMRRRRVKRDAADTQKKGVAGILLHAPPEPTDPKSDEEEAEERPQRRTVTSQTRRRQRRRDRSSETVETEAAAREANSDLAEDLANLSLGPSDRSG